LAHSLGPLVCALAPDAGQVLAGVALLQAVWATWHHRIFDLAAELPGQDDIVLAHAPIAKFALVRSPEHARHVLLTNQDNYI